MTVCLAFRGLTFIGTPEVSHRETIVAVFDRMVSYGDDSVDHALYKRFRIHARWRAMFSGDDISPVTPLMRIVQGHLASR
jgi:hypothetical protein